MSYRTTSVPVHRSQEQIRQMLMKQSVRGIQFSEDFETGSINIRFAKDIGGVMRTVSVSLTIPEPPQRKRKASRPFRWSHGRMVATKTAADRKEQMARATYRALHDWLKAQFVAVEYGLLTFEDVFLAHFEWMIDGRTTTVGQIVRPALTSGRLLLPGVEDGEVVD